MDAHIRQNKIAKGGNSMSKGKKLTQRKIAMKRRKMEREARRKEAEKTDVKSWVTGITAIVIILAFIIAIPLLSALLLAKYMHFALAMLVGIGILLLIAWGLCKGLIYFINKYDL